MPELQHGRLFDADTADHRVSAPGASPAPSADASPPQPGRRFRRRWLVASLALAVVALPAAWGGYRVFAPQSGPEGPSEVSIVGTGKPIPPSELGSAESASGGHPLDPALEIARDGLSHIRADIHDYTARLIKRERIGGELGAEEVMQVKIRNRKTEGGKIVVPLSVYMRFVKPESKKGREVIWVENRNDGNLIAHDPNLPEVFHIRAELAPDNFLSMAGNRYPITQIGIENLIVQLVQRGEREKKLGPCEVQFFDDQQLNDRLCKRILIRHPDEKPEYDFFEGEIYIDKKLFVPVRYAAYRWPEADEQQPRLEEEYTYLDLRLNVGLTDKDFDPENPEYGFP